MISNQALVKMSSYIINDNKYLAESITEADLASNIISHRDYIKRTDPGFYHEMNMMDEIELKQIFEIKALLAYTPDHVVDKQINIYNKDLLESEIDELHEFFSEYLDHLKNNPNGTVYLEGFGGVAAGFGAGVLGALGAVSIAPFLASSIGSGFKILLALPVFGKALIATLTVGMAIAAFLNRDRVLFSFIRLLKSIGQALKNRSSIAYIVDAYKSNNIYDDLKAMDIRDCATKCGLPDIPSREILQHMQFKKDGEVDEWLSNTAIAPDRGREKQVKCAISCILDFLSTTIAGLAVVNLKCNENSSNALSNIAKSTRAQGHMINPDCEFIVRQMRDVESVYYDFLKSLYRDPSSQQDVDYWHHALAQKIEAGLNNKPVTGYTGKSNTPMDKSISKNFELSMKAPASNQGNYSNNNRSDRGSSNNKHRSNSNSNQQHRPNNRWSNKR